MTAEQGAGVKDQETASEQIDKACFDAFFAAAKKDRKCVEALAKLGEAPLNLTGLATGQKTYLTAVLGQKKQGGLTVLLVPDRLSADQWAAALAALTGRPEQVLVWSGRDFSWTDMEASARASEQQRLGTLHRLQALKQSVKGGFLIIPAVTLLRPAPAGQVLADYTVNLNLTDEPGPLAVAGALEAAGYEQVGRAEVPGQFARRGDIVDVVPVGGRFGAAGTGYRLSFFDRAVDSLRCYDTDSQRSLDNVEAVSIPPAREVILNGTDRQALLSALDRERESSLRRLKQEGVIEKVRRQVDDLFSKDMDRIAAGINFPGLDRWLSLIYPEQLPTIWDYLPKNSLLIVDEPARLRKRLDEFAAETEGRLRRYVEEGKSPAVALKNLLRPNQPLIKLQDFKKLVSLSFMAAGGNGFAGGTTLALPGREQDGFRGKEQALAATILKQQRQGDRVFIAVPPGDRQGKLQALLAEKEAGDVVYLPFGLDRGFIYPGAALVVYGVRDIFGDTAKRSRRRHRKGQTIDLFSDLKAGDPVVHDVYGIGIYEGLVKLENSGVYNDYLKVSYAGDDVLYLPMKDLDQLQKYVGMSGRKPKLSRLGGNDWNRLKERAREGVRKLATDLVALYAKRNRIKGFAFQPDTPWEEEFAASFPYEETADQLRSIAEVKGDMESNKVMDRLLCGDVGFGKTEVAFRAIFKCVAAGKQAAMIAPTTVLVQQHYENLLERLGEFPLRVGMLSRFAEPEAVKATIKGLANGMTDVVIGTHRLLSADIKFKDLGLLVIDEEQRFGVDHKEKLKEQHPAVDVLTLSATPIPRTLHMSLAGIRDISILEEPPEDRRSVQTFVMEYDPDLIQNGIERELDREGQVFYLFNDTRRIYDKAAELQESLPAARIDVAHGRMHESQLEQVIEAFVAGAIDILVCTTIIESGIDMPNVNTIVVENADRMGLAQLYQLRGRVGRSARQAYAYITYKRDKVLTEEAEKRLISIRDYTELGAGFKIAMKDLEVRGAGNLLGGEQHGQMEAIGYDLYCRMLEEEVAEARAAVEVGAEATAAAATAEVKPAASGPVVPSATELQQPRVPALKDTVFELAVDAYIDPAYIEDDAERIDAYRRISLIKTAADHGDVADELTDRYGDLPEQVLMLLDVAYVRAAAGAFGYGRIRPLPGGRVQFLFGRNNPADMAGVAVMLNLDRYKDQIEFSAASKEPYLLLKKVPTEAKKIPVYLRRFFMAAETVIRQECAPAQPS